MGPALEALTRLAGALLTLRRGAALEAAGTAGETLTVAGSALTIAEAAALEALARPLARSRAGARRNLGGGQTLGRGLCGLGVGAGHRRSVLAAATAEAARTGVAALATASGELAALTTRAAGALSAGRTLAFAAAEA